MTAHTNPDIPAPLLAVPSTPTLDELTPQGLGVTLRLLRESRAWSVAQVCARLKFSMRQIQALEAEDWGQLPDGLALRGLVRNYARLLEVDADMMLALLDAATPQAKVPRRVLSTDLVRDTPRRFEERSHNTWGWMAVIALLILVAVFYIISRGGLPEFWHDGIN